MDLRIKFANTALMAIAVTALFGLTLPIGHRYSAIWALLVFLVVTYISWVKGGNRPVGNRTAFRAQLLVTFTFYVPVFIALALGYFHASGAIWLSFGGVFVVLFAISYVRGRHVLASS